jgi:hypothetical protein
LSAITALSCFVLTLALPLLHCFFFFFVIICFYYIINRYLFFLSKVSRHYLFLFTLFSCFWVYNLLEINILYYPSPSATRRHGNFAGVYTLLRILLSSNSAVLINIITGVSPPHYDFVVYYVLCQC